MIGRSAISLLLSVVLGQGAVFAPPSVPPVDVGASLVRLQMGVLPVAADRGPSRVRPESLGVVTDAPVVMIRDVDSGVVLYERGTDAVLPIASITKLMTALVLTSDAAWNEADAASVVREDVRPGGRWYYRFGDPLTKSDLLTMMLVASGNNETMALVRLSGQTEAQIVQAMNDRAQALGMTQTTFADPVGLLEGNRSTARDLTILLREVMQQDAIASRVSRASVTATSELGNTYKESSTNLLFDSFVNRGAFTLRGGKTGTTDEAGFCLVSRVEHAGHAVDVIVLGAHGPENRFQDVQDLVAWAFDVFSWDV